MSEQSVTRHVMSHQTWLDGVTRERTAREMDEEARVELRWARR